MDGDDETGFPFASRLGGEKNGEPPDGGDEGEELVAPGDIYATIKGPRLSLAIEFIDKDRRSFTVPYSYLPLLWWQPPGSLIIEYPGLFSVSLKGKELDGSPGYASSTSTRRWPYPPPSPASKSCGPTHRTRRVPVATTNRLRAIEPLNFAFATRRPSVCSF
jgi:hypothetical protein